MKKPKSKYIEEFPIDKLIEDPNNPNYMTEDQFDSLGHSLDRDLLKPFLVDQKGMIVDGTHSIKKLREIGDIKKDIEEQQQLNRNSLERKIRKAKNKMVFLDDSTHKNNVAY